MQSDWYQKKKVTKLNLVPNAAIIKRLIIAVNHSLNSSPPTGCDFFITLDLRQSVKKRNFLLHLILRRQPNISFSLPDAVLRMNQVTCLEAMVLLALTFRKREKNTKIYSFGDNEDTLLPIKLTTDMTFEKALSHCETLLVSFFFLIFGSLLVHQLK